MLFDSDNPQANDDDRPEREDVDRTIKTVDVPDTDNDTSDDD